MKKFKIDRNIPKMFKIWFVIPFVIILIAAAVFTGYAVSYKDISKGMNIGTDFAGGSVVNVVLGEDELSDSSKYNKHLDTIKDVLQDDEIAKQVVEIAKEKYDITIDASAVKATISYSQKSDSGASMALVVKYDNISKTYDPNNELTGERNTLIEEKIKEIYSEENGYKNVSVTMSNIGATASESLINTAIISLAISLAIILVYVIIRFELWSGLAAIIALIHDVAIMVALTIAFHIQVNSSFIAAMITIVAYSINNTIIIFDRVRENNKIEKKLNTNAIIDNFEIADKSTKQSMTRTINTTVTTMFAIVIFAIIGTASVREFALPVIFGLIAGFYSSVFISPALYALMKNAGDKWKRERASKAAPTFVGQKKKKNA